MSTIDLGSLPPPSPPEPEQTPPASSKPAGWALALSMLPFPPALLVSLVLSIVTLTRPRGGRDHGREMAIGALCLIGFWVVALAVLIGSLVADGGRSTTAAPQASTGEVAITSLRTGDCLAEDQISEGLTLTVEVLPCSEPHGAKVYATFELSGDYPGTAEARRIGDGGCTSRLPAGVPRDQVYYYFMPQNEVGWSLNPSVTCIMDGGWGTR